MVPPRTLTSMIFYFAIALLHLFFHALTGSEINDILDDQTKSIKFSNPPKANYYLAKDDYQMYHQLLQIEKELDQQAMTFDKKDDRSVGKYLLNVIKRLTNLNPFPSMLERVGSAIAYGIGCTTCRIYIRILLMPQFSLDSVMRSANKFCKLFMNGYTCSHFLYHMRDTVGYVKNNTQLSADEICTILINTNCKYRLQSNNINWLIDIPERKVTKQKERYGENKKNELGKDEGVSFIHITDAHLDLEYTDGSLANCGLPLCCRGDVANARSVNQSELSGYWGDYRSCDLPYRTIKRVILDIKEAQPKADFLLFTGDILPHDIWNCDRERNFIHIKNFTHELHKNLPFKVFPIIGNHEAVLVGTFSPTTGKISNRSDLSTDWLFESLADIWSVMLPESAIETVREGGHYMVKISPSLRLIALNTNFCSRLNVWTYLDPIDPGNQLKFLAYELQAAEEAGDVVYIAGHIPPDNYECMRTWVHNYLILIERFQDIIKGQFFGHTHFDEFRVFYGQNYQPIGLGLIAPGLTAWSASNPAYRVYKADSHGTILNYFTYYFNLKVENERPAKTNLTWMEEYNALEYFGISNITGQTYDMLTQRFADSNFLSRYLRVCRVNKTSDEKTWDIYEDPLRYHKVYDLMKGNAFYQNVLVVHSDTKYWQEN